MTENTWEKEFEEEYGSLPLEQWCVGLVAAVMSHNQLEPFGSDASHITRKLQEKFVKEVAAAKELEVVICAAVRAKDGFIYRGHRHAHALYRPFGLQGVPGYENERPHGDDQGFITSRNRYVSREEAMQIFKTSGAVSADEEKHPVANRGELYSEDLY